MVTVSRNEAIEKIIKFILDNQEGRPAITADMLRYGFVGLCQMTNAQLSLEMNMRYAGDHQVKMPKDYEVSRRIDMGFGEVSL